MLRRPRRQFRHLRVGLPAPDALPATIEATGGVDQEQTARDLFGEEFLLEAAVVAGDRCGA